MPMASCQRCEAITSSIETACMPLYNPGRYHLGLRARKTKRPHLRLRANLGRLNENVYLDKDAHPGVLWGFHYSFPEILIGLPPSEDEFSGNAMMAPAVPDFKNRVKQIGVSVNVTVGAGVSQISFGRFLAKIAHSYTVAEIGIGVFSPLLLDIILGRDLSRLRQLIGSPIGNDDWPTSDSLHDISFVDFSRKYLVVKIRLFQKNHLPTYYVVSGKIQ